MKGEADVAAVGERDPSRDQTRSRVQRIRRWGRTVLVAAFALHTRAARVALLAARLTVGRWVILAPPAER